MVKRLPLLPLLVVGVVLLAGYRMHQNARAADVSNIPYGYNVGQRAPEFDLLAVGDGGKVRLSSLKGRPVVINFFCGCNFCSIVGEEWVKNRDKVGDATVLAIAANHWTYTPPAVRSFRKKTGWPWPVLADLQSRTANDFKALTCPRVFVVDGDGIVRYSSAEGASDEKQIIAEALAALGK
jgi:cytochrome c biogenesis protein CcmG, thiol:disulfide interchange protein DsbE